MIIDFAWGALVLSGLRLATPLLFAALGGLLSERSGIANIALEGFILVGAFSAAAVTAIFGNPWLGMLAGVFAGAFAGAIFGWMTVVLRGDHIVMGTAFNLLVMGLLPIFCKALFGTPSSTPALSIDHRLDTWFLIGLSFFLAFLIRFILYRTVWGFRIRASGENIEATKSLGVSVTRSRWTAVILSGAVASLGGVFLAIAHGSQFARGMSAGRGFIALAALILAGWRPLPVVLTCLLFGFADAAQILLQSFPMPWGGTLPVQFIQILPYLVTVLVMVGMVGKIEAPQAIGKNES